MGKQSKPRRQKVWKQVIVNDETTLVVRRHPDENERKKLIEFILVALTVLPENKAQTKDDDKEENVD